MCEKKWFILCKFFVSSKVSPFFNLNAAENKPQSRDGSPLRADLRPHSRQSLRWTPLVSPRPQGIAGKLVTSTFCRIDNCLLSGNGEVSMANFSSPPLLHLSSVPQECTPLARESDEATNAGKTRKEDGRLNTRYVLPAASHKSPSAPKPTLRLSNTHPSPPDT